MIGTAELDPNPSTSAAAPPPARVDLIIQKVIRRCGRPSGRVNPLFFRPNTENDNLLQDEPMIVYDDQDPINVVTTTQLTKRGRRPYTEAQREAANFSRAQKKANKQTSQAITTPQTQNGITRRLNRVN